MFKNRFLIVLGVLSLLLVAMVISVPLRNTPTSGERGRVADAARWTAMGEYYEKLEESQLQRSRAADTARWNAMAEHYQTLEAAQGMERSRAADTARWTSMAEYYHNLAGFRLDPALAPHALHDLPYQRQPDPGIGVLLHLVRFQLMGSRQDRLSTLGPLFQR